MKLSNVIYSAVIIVKFENVAWPYTQPCTKELWNWNDSATRHLLKISLWRWTMCILQEVGWSWSARTFREVQVLFHSS